MAEANALDGAELEATGQVSDWVELEDGKTRVRLTFIPAAHWTSILSRQEVLSKGAGVVEARLAEGTSDDAAKDAHRFGVYKTTLLEVAGETVARSLREIEGQKPFELVAEKMNPSDVESLAVDGLFWLVHNAVIHSHWTDNQQARALFCRWVGQSV
jgi:hypothetical protein